MTPDIALYLGQNAVTLGAVYALLALALVLIFSVTRVIFVPQGEIMTFGALTLVQLRAGVVPPLIWVICALALVAAAADLLVEWRAGRRERLWRVIVANLAWPATALSLCLALPLGQIGYGAQIALALFVSGAMGPLIYRLVFQPAAKASVLTLLLLAVALHVAMTSLGLFLFGPDGSGLPAFTSGSFMLGGMPVTDQTLWIWGSALVLVMALFLFFRQSLYGKALRATSISRTGAQLVGISPSFAGKLAFTLASIIGAWSGILVATTAVLAYDSGFVIGLKGFVAAIVGGLTAYPVAAAGALLVGFIESFASFWASPYKDVIVFGLIIPVLIWRSIGTPHSEEEE
jgi:branched-chain amino acid transport system permease protein